MREKAELLFNALHDQQHVGASALRQKGICRTGKVVIIHAHAQPVAALIPYHLYLSIQNCILEVDAALRSQGLL